MHLVSYFVLFTVRLLFTLTAGFLFILFSLVLFFHSIHSVIHF